MRATFVTTHYPPSSGFGGVCESSFGISSAIAGAGVSIDVVTSDASKGSRIPVEDFAKIESPGLTIHPFKYLCSEKSCFSFDARRVMKELIAKSDLVHVNGIYTHPVTLGTKYARRNGKPHLVAIRNGLDPWMLQVRHTKKMLGFHMYVRRDLCRATCIHATAKQEVDACVQMGLKGPFTIIPNGINPQEYEHLPDHQRAEEMWPVLKGRRVVLFLSRLSQQKGLDMLIQGWESIVKRHPDAILVIAGPDYLKYGDFVRGLAKKTAASRSILFSGNTTGERKLALFRRADVFTLPSYSENFGNVIAEALACGTPVVTTQATPWPMIEKVDCGRWIPTEEHALIEALSEMISKPRVERKAMGQRGRELILSNYTWDIAARKMITVYRAMLNGDEIPLHPSPWEGDA